MKIIRTSMIYHKIKLEYANKTTERKC